MYYINERSRARFVRKNHIRILYIPRGVIESASAQWSGSCGGGEEVRVRFSVRSSSKTGVYRERESEVGIAHWKAAAIVTNYPFPIRSTHLKSFRERETRHLALPRVYIRIYNASPIRDDASARQVQRRKRGSIYFCASAGERDAN